MSAGEVGRALGGEVAAPALPMITAVSMEEAAVTDGPCVNMQAQGWLTGGWIDAAVRVMSAAEMGGITWSLAGTVQWQQIGGHCVGSGMDSIGFEDQSAIEHHFEAILAIVIVDISLIARWPDQQ